MKSISVTIVEDELLIAESIRIYLIERGHQVVDICISYEEAIASLNNNPPDIFLLDIRLYGDKSGIDVAHHIAQNTSIPYVFLTSQYDEVILKRAITTSPFGYLTKPFRKETLWTTIEASFHLSEGQKSSEVYLQVFDGQKNHKVSLKEIIYIKSEHVYIEIFLNSGESILIRKTITDFLETLNDDNFLMPHRSFIVNTKYINSWDQNNIYLNTVEIPISRSRKKSVLETLTKINEK